MKSQYTPSENKFHSQKDNKENNGNIKKTTDNNHLETKNAELLGNSSGLETNVERQKSNDPTEEEEEDAICHHCKEKIDKDWKEPHWKWNLDKNTKFCIKCYGTKELEYEKRMNYCVACESKLKFIRYNPKPEWKIRGQMCRFCWDSQNRKYKEDKKRLGI